MGVTPAKKGTMELLKSTPVEVQSTHTSELVIALCGPIGTPLHDVAKLLKDLLIDRYAYECEIIQLSKIIEEFEGAAPAGNKFDRINYLIDKGNDLRKASGSSVLTDIAISKIATSREKYKDTTGSRKFEPRRICHIIDSIKNQEELEALRLVYRDMLHFVGVFSPMPLREKFLRDLSMDISQIYTLIDRDSGEEFAHGQTVRDTFPHADLFLRIDSDSEGPIQKKLERFLDLIFETEIITPSTAETAMYVAASAAGSSGCLSRQVGAAITDKNGEIIATGWNDVPKMGGGLYQFNIGPADNDKRCYLRGSGSCVNDTEKKLMVEKIVDDIVSEKLMDEGNREKAINVIRKSKIKDLLEFSRSVHAEMHAIIIGSQLAGDKIKGGRLYCTTYPCHSCARHIILAGITEVYYIEPYRKSLATKLHDDAITEVETDLSMVRILPFDGVAPSRYLGLFSMRPDSRKDEKTGKLNKPDKKKTSPKSEVTLESIPALEGLVVQRLVRNKIIELSSNGS